MCVCVLREGAAYCYPDELTDLLAYPTDTVGYVVGGRQQRADELTGDLIQLSYTCLKLRDDHTNKSWLWG